MNVFILETVNFIKSRKLLPTNINKTTGNKTWLKLGTSPQMLNKHRFTIYRRPRKKPHIEAVEEYLTPVFTNGII